MTSITRGILKWTDKEMDKVLNDENTKHRGLKAVGLGMVEGFVDGAIIAYPILVAGCIYWRKKAGKR